MSVLSGQFADVGRTLGIPIVSSLFADVLTKPADLAIGDHRAPQSGQCKPGLSFRPGSSRMPPD